MTASHYDVLVVGAGCAGLTAAIGLARAGFTVAVVEAAKTAGGAGMLGGVCVADNLTQPDILGSEGTETLAWERRLVERGSFATDGRRIAGSIYRDADALHVSYTVLRSRFTQTLAERARRHGVSVRVETAVESLIRAGRRVVGVATTPGPLYASLVFLAEGDAGLLLSREGLDRFSDPRDRPGFLYCLQQIIELPPGAVEERFRVEAEQGAAYDFLLRNPASLPLNARGLLCTNRQGLTLSVLLPATNLQHWFRGEPRQLLDWFVDMPALHPWVSGGRRGAWTASLLRTGGLRDVPYLIEDGLAVGGAAAGLGIDFPVLNLMGPALASAVLLSRAAARIRGEGRDFDRDSLARHYLEPLRQSRYWRDMEFVQRWPGYVERANILFGYGLDLLLDSTAVWTRPRRWLLWKLLAWLGVLSRVSWNRWNELRDELLQLGRVLHLRQVIPRPPLGRLLLDGALNAFRDLVRKPRPHLPPRGTLRLYYHAAGEQGRASASPWLFRRWFERFRPVLAAVGRTFYSNDDISLSAKFTRIFAFLLQQINLLDFAALVGFVFPIALASTALAAGRFVIRRPRRDTGQQSPAGAIERSETQSRQAVESAESVYPAPPLIRIAWHSTNPKQQATSVRDLSHICPAGVFDITEGTPQSTRVAVHAERCVFCQACWRSNPVVDWGRRGVAAPMNASVTVLDTQPRGAAASLLDALQRKFQEFDAALAEGPSLVDRPHNDYLEMLAGVAQKLALSIREVLSTDAAIDYKLRQPLSELANALVARAEMRTRRTWEGRFTWAAADGRLLCQHHLTQLRRLLALPEPAEPSKKKTAALACDWLPALPPLRGEEASVKHMLAGVAARHYLLESLESFELAAVKPIQTELLNVLVDEIRADLSARERELRSQLAYNPAAIPPKSFPAFESRHARYGCRLFIDTVEMRKLFDVPGEWPRMEQFHLLRAECEELADSERRLLAQAEALAASDRQAAGETVNAAFGRQAAHILAGKILLLRSFARLEMGEDAELAMLLLRVWLDYTATLLDEHTIVVREYLHPTDRRDDRPLVEPESGAPLRTQADYLAAPATYTHGDFLLLPLDFRQPRLVPEMVGEKEIASASPDFAAWLRLLKSFELQQGSIGAEGAPPLSAQIFYLTEALIVEIIGRNTADPSLALDLEWSCTRFFVAELHQAGAALRERCTILSALVEVVVPRLLGGSMDTRVRHLERDTLELESLKADFRQRLTGAWQAMGESLGRNADVQASCFALAEAAAWLKAADSALGRMAWLSRSYQADDREEPASQQELGRRALAHCLTEIRDRLFRFDEDLASLRRGYYAPHVYAAALLLRQMPAI